MSCSTTTKQPTTHTKHVQRSAEQSPHGAPNQRRLLPTIDVLTLYKATFETAPQYSNTTPYYVVCSRGLLLLLLLLLLCVRVLRVQYTVAHALAELTHTEHVQRSAEPPLAIMHDTDLKVYLHACASIDAKHASRLSPYPTRTLNQQSELLWLLCASSHLHSSSSSTT